MRLGRIFVCVLAVTMLLVCLCACSDDGELQQGDVYYDVVFDSAGGSAVEKVTVLSGSTIAVPEEPVKEGYIFNGWRKSGVEWDFGTDKVTSNITLTAGWIDATMIFKYEVKDEKAIITDYTGEMDELRIPTMIGGFDVVGIGDGAFQNTPSETTSEIILGENILTVGNYAFSGCAKIKIVIESELVSVGERAFYGCGALESVTLGSGLKEIPSEAFSNCTALTAVVLSDTLESIGENAFDGCAEMKTIIVHSSLKSVADSAFNGCSGLKAVYYYGTAEQWAATQIATGNSGNTALTEASFYMYSETEPSADAEGKYWHYQDNGKIRIW